MDEFTEGRNVHRTSFEVKQSYYRGSAKVKFGFLDFEKGNEGGKFLDQKNVQRLVQVYRYEGCRPLEPENRIPALVSQTDLHCALSNSQLSQGDLFRWSGFPPELRFHHGGVLRCLAGKHRIHAADIYIEDPLEKWWIVDLYLEGLRTPSYDFTCSLANFFKTYRTIWCYISERKNPTQPHTLGGKYSETSGITRGCRTALG